MKYLPLFLSLLPFCLPAIDAGKEMPEADVAKWYFKRPPIQDNLTAVVIFDSTAEDAAQLLRMLETIQTEQQLSIAAIAMNGQEQTDRFIKANVSFVIGVAVDKELKTRKKLAETESLFPYAVLAKDGKVIWSGHPTELDMIMEQFRNGDFSLSTQRKVENLRRELQMAIQSGLPAVISSIADKILQLSPADHIAIQAKLLALNSTGRSDEIPSFIQKVCEQNPKDIKLRIMQLDLLLGRGDAEAFIQTVEKFSKDFPVPEKKLVQPIAFIVENAPYGLLNPTILLTLGQRAYDSLGKEPAGQHPLLHAIAYETLARVRATFGDFKEAFRLQELATQLRKGTAQEKAAARRLEYYRNLLELSSPPVPVKERKASAPEKAQSSVRQKAAGR